MTASHRRGILAGVVLGAAVAAALASGGERTQAAEGDVGPLPVLGPGDKEMVLMGSAPGGETGEAWGYRQLPNSIGGVMVGSRELEFGEPANPGQPDRQLAFVRHTDATGWQVFDTPVDEDGEPYRGPTPNARSARITPSGGGVLVGRDTSRPSAEQVVVIHRDPGGAWRVLDAPPPAVLLPGEALAETNGTGPVANAAFEEGGGTGLLFGPKGLPVEDAIIHYDGQDWTREPVILPGATELEILAIDATGLDNAWALARDDSARSVVLLERTTPPGGPEWVERALGATPFADADNPGEGIAENRAAEGPSQPLTVTDDGAWIDFRATIDGADRSATLYYDAGAAAVTGSWCDADPCADPLGVMLSRQVGYRSFAWAGPGFGTRIITNPLDPGGDETTNRGTYLRFEGGAFARLPGGGANFRPSGAFESPDSGWLEGPVEISAKGAPAAPRTWPVSLRAPLTDVTGEPGAPSGAVGSEAIAVGLDGSVARYEPGEGWTREFLLTSSGAVNKASLRGVAWPTRNRAHAVGDLGAMWQWNAEDDLWSVDEGVPIGFEGNLMDVAFDPTASDRGYAVGRRGTLLRYDKSWEQESLPSGFSGRDLSSIAFAGSQAIVAAGSDLLVNDGAGWRVDSSARSLLQSTSSGGGQLFAVAGLPDGGAVAAGRDIVIERDGPSSPWRFSRQPLPGSTVIAAAAVRSTAPGRPVRAIVSVVPQVSYPPGDDLPDPDPNVPPPILPPFALPSDGYLLAETESGWVDEQRTTFGASTQDRPIKSDPVLALLLDASGNGWAVGGWGGHGDAVGRGASAAGSTGQTIRTRVRTSTIFRHGNAVTPPSTARRVEVGMPAGPARFAVAGHAQCQAACADLAPYTLGPDRTLIAAQGRSAEMAGGAGPRALLYTGNRVESGLDDPEAARFADLLATTPGLPAFPALGSSDASNGTGAAAFRSAFAGFPAPLGSGAPPDGVSTSGIPGAAPSPGEARTHYAFDSSGPGGTVRVVVIDNSLGSLAASDPHQNPLEPQLPWLEAVLADARAEEIPVVVMGNRSLNDRFSPTLNTADDATEVARTLVDGGASAYLFDRPEENRLMAIPAGGQTTIPSWGVGTLGYRPQLSAVTGIEASDSLFGDTGVLVLEVDAQERDPGTNRAPVAARLIPVIGDLAIEPVDGTFLRRSRPALFRGLGRRPISGDRWGPVLAGPGTPEPSGGDPYTQFPPQQCLIAGCSARVIPEYTFTSSDPDIADFVRQDPASSNLRKPYLDPATDKVVTDNSSGLLCPFNAGTTTITISAGGFSHSEQVRVQDGSVLRPCGTRPLDESRFPEPSQAAPPPPVNEPASNPIPPAVPPPPVIPAAVPPAVAPPPSRPRPPAPPRPPTLAVPTPAALTSFPPVPPILPLPAPPIARPIPPGGAPARVFEEKREEEVAVEESQAFARHDASEGAGVAVPPYLPAMILVAALLAATARGRHRGRPRPAPLFTDANLTRRRQL